MQRVGESLGVLCGLGPDTCENITNIKLMFTANVTGNIRNTYCYGNKAMCVTNKHWRKMYLFSEWKVLDKNIQNMDLGAITT